jgi:hypothetical protein
MSTFPQLSFACPIPWNEMRGDERARFCSKCSRTVVNLSLLTEAERVALLAEAQRTPGGLCVAYYRRLSGEFVDADAPLTPTESRRAVQFGVTALSAAALAMVAHHAPAIGRAVDGASTSAAHSYMALRDEAIVKTKETMANIGRFFGGKPKDDTPVLILGAMICTPATAPSPTPPSSGAAGATATPSQVDS